MCEGRGLKRTEFGGKCPPETPPRVAIVAALKLHYRNPIGSLLGGDPAVPPDLPPPSGMEAGRAGGEGKEGTEVARVAK